MSAAMPGWRRRGGTGTGAGHTRGCCAPSAVPNHHLLVQGTQRLVVPPRRPHVEAGRALQGQELPPVTLLPLLLALAGSRRLLMSANAVLVIDGRVLDVAVELPEVLRIEHRHGHRRPLCSVLLVHELEHEVVVGVGGGGGIGTPPAENLLAVPVEDT